MEGRTVGVGWGGGADTISMGWGDSGCSQSGINSEPQSGPQALLAGQLFPALRFPAPCYHPPSPTCLMGP